MSKNNKHNKMDWVAGLHAVENVLRHRPETVTGLWINADRKDERLNLIQRLAEQMDLTIYPVSREQLEKRAPNMRHQGVIAQIKASQLMQEAGLEALVEQAGSKLLLLILDGIQDPHNLGACLRTANASGVNAVLLPRDKAVGLTPVVRKVASGAAELTPVIQVANLSRTLKQLKSWGVWLVGTSDQASADVYSIDFRQPVGLVLGAEASGMRRLTSENCDQLTHIPMRGQVESLNVSVAAGVCLYEALRQRLSK